MNRIIPNETSYHGAGAVKDRQEGTDPSTLSCV
jgi:hypothetical protein